MRQLLRISLLLVFLFSLSYSSLGRAEVVDKVVAVVNNDVITLYELDKMMAQNIDLIKKSQGLKQKKEFQDLRQAALKRLIEEKLLEQEIAKRKLVITEEDVEKAIKSILERNKLTMEQLKKELSAKGQSWSSYREQIKEQLKRIKFMGQVIAPRVKITDADLDEFFAKNPDKFARFQSVEMAQIIIPVGPGANDDELTKAQQLAAEVAKKAQRGGNFEEMGKKYSANPQTAVRDVYQVAQLAPQIAAIVADLKPGQVSEPVRSNLGLHVIKLYQRKTLAGEEYRAIREQIREKVYEFKIEQETLEYLEDVKNRSFIEIKT